MEFAADVVDAVLTHMNDDHAADSLRIARAHGHPAATAAEMTAFDSEGGTWHVTEGFAEATLRIGWPGGPITGRAEIRRAVVDLHEASCELLGVAGDAP